MVLSRTTIRSAAQVDRMPADVLRLTNQYIHEDSQADMFLSVFYAMLETRTGRLTYSNAGHNPPLWWRSETGMLEQLSEHGTLVGVLDDLHLNNHTVELAGQDTLVLYTDGVTDAINKCEEDLGMARLENVLVETLDSNRSLEAQDIVDIIVDAVIEHTGDQAQFDDVAIMVIKRMSAYLGDREDI